MAAEIRSPLPGTFYRKPAPDQPAYVEDGAAVKKGDVIGLVEVMKSFHEVRADIDGANARFLVENEAPVMAGAVLVELD
ncbi:MAG: biotin carboxyl carrier domain-containing protein [Rhodobacteraceae bacterium]|nr:MAG: biotin carboxyl carrier domain-containing protein [Paracoccaceae bacterium]